MSFHEVLNSFTVERLIAIRQNKEALIKKYRKEIEAGSTRQHPRYAILQLSREIDVLTRELESRGHKRRSFKQFMELFR